MRSVPYNFIEGEHTVELILKPSCCGKETSSSYVAGVHLTVKDISTFGLNNKKMKGHALWDMGLAVLRSMKKALSILPKLSPSIVLIDKNCAVTGYASGKNETNFHQYRDNRVQREVALINIHLGEQLSLDSSTI